MRRETIYKIQEPVRWKTNSASVEPLLAIMRMLEQVDEETDSTTAESGDEFGDKIGEVIEGIANRVCDVIDRVCYAGNTLALDIACAAATRMCAED